jgi:radical SAM superfamily enzyme YgiQ (UPF0313 family)
MTVEDNVRAFKLCRQYGIKTFANMLFNLPGETKDDIDLSRRFLDLVKPDTVGFSLTVPLLGTRIYREHVLPPLTPSEYSVYATNDPYVRIVDRRFRMAAHDLDLDKLLLQMSLKYYLSSSFGQVSKERWYRDGILRRMSRVELLKAVGLRAVVQLKSYARGVPQSLVRRKRVQIHRVHE